MSAFRRPTRAGYSRNVLLSNVCLRPGNQQLGGCANVLLDDSKLILPLHPVHSTSSISSSSNHPFRSSASGIPPGSLTPSSPSSSPSTSPPSFSSSTSEPPTVQTLHGKYENNRCVREACGQDTPLHRSSARSQPPSSVATLACVQLPTETDEDDEEEAPSSIPRPSHPRTSPTASAASNSRARTSNHAGLHTFCPRRGTGVGSACSVDNVSVGNAYGDVEDRAWNAQPVPDQRGHEDVTRHQRRAHPAHAVNPTESFTDTVALINVSAELGVILMCIQAKERRVDGGFCYQRLRNKET